jgi:putative transcriptional regulator
MRACRGQTAVPVNNRLRVLRAERRWSQAELAERLGVSRQTVNAVETGKYDPSLPLAFRIAALFGTTIEAVFQNNTGAVPHDGDDASPSVKPS